MVTNEGLKELASCKNLTSLNVYGTQVTAAGVAMMMKELPKCKVRD